MVEVNTGVAEQKEATIEPINGMAIYISELAKAFKTVAKDEIGSIRKTPTELLMKFAPGEEWMGNDVNDFILQMKANGLEPVIENNDTDFDFVYYLLPK